MYKSTLHVWLTKGQLKYSLGFFSIAVDCFFIWIVPCVLAEWYKSTYLLQALQKPTAPRRPSTGAPSIRQNKQQWTIFPSSFTQNFTFRSVFPNTIFYDSWAIFLLPFLWFFFYLEVLLSFGSDSNRALPSPLPGRHDQDFQD